MATVPTEEVAKTLGEWLEDDDQLDVEKSLKNPANNVCSFSRGYIKQDVYVCLTCSGEKGQPVRFGGIRCSCADEIGQAGICAACAIHCHEDHDVLELWQKRNFRCDCGTSRMPCMLLDFTVQSLILCCSNSIVFIRQGSYQIGCRKHKFLQPQLRGPILSL